MFEDESMSGAGCHIQPIKFTVIDEDDLERDNQHSSVAEAQGKQTSRKQPHKSIDSESNGDRAHNELKHRSINGGIENCNAASSLSFEQSFPAVVLENVCFSVDRSQQQANFLKECIYRFNTLLNPILNGGPPDNKVQILKSVDLIVPSGSIFGLLGPSSCGKTTLLRCLVGLLKPTSGTIKLLGSTNHDLQRQHEYWAPCQSSYIDLKVPGSNVGYMPQDLGLYEDFTIEQLLIMFGQYMRMKPKLIKSRINFMANFLELPDVTRQIQTLSGGQKRRVSFAIACLHMPPLIILDEPTVGVDPLLRQSIWKYLRRLASEENKTIIITTHYIEEAAQADQVAFMRAGKILIQDTPAKIMESNKSTTLEEAFLKICNNVQAKDSCKASDEVQLEQAAQPSLFSKRQLVWNESESTSIHGKLSVIDHMKSAHGPGHLDKSTVMRDLKLCCDSLKCCKDATQICFENQGLCSEQRVIDKLEGLASDNLSMIPNASMSTHARQCQSRCRSGKDCTAYDTSLICRKRKFRLVKRRNKLTFNDVFKNNHTEFNFNGIGFVDDENALERFKKCLTVFWALIYKNYRRNVNSLPLLAFQFMLPMIQMISFSLCVGGRPTNVGLGLVNHDKPISFGAAATDDPVSNVALIPSNTSNIELDWTSRFDNESLSLRYLSFIDKEMLQMRPYDNLESALADVRRAKLWAVLEIGENFTIAISKRFDLDNFYQLEPGTIAQSVIKIYPDRSNKILDMICHRSLVDSYRKFLSAEFDQFKRLPIEIARPIFDIEPNVISNSIDGYTESIAPGLLASLTYIMAAGLTTFIMVVERSAGILERTYTSGINPVSYLLAHAIFRSLVMMLQIAAVLVLTFYILRQPLVGSIWLAYAMLMTLNITGISYGLLISSIVSDQNGAALTIVSSLVVKITMSGILWPFEAIPQWLRTICYIQPLTMPVQALKAITLKGATFGDRAVNLGFLVSITWLLVFLTISTKRFKFYQH